MPPIGRRIVLIMYNEPVSSAVADLTQVFLADVVCLQRENGVYINKTRGNIHYQLYFVQECAMSMQTVDFCSAVIDEFTVNLIFKLAVRSVHRI
jgi:hypothetical protein